MRSPQIGIRLSFCLEPSGSNLVLAPTGGKFVGSSKWLQDFGANWLQTCWLQPAPSLELALFGSSPAGADDIHETHSTRFPGWIVLKSTGCGVSDVGPGLIQPGAVAARRAHGCTAATTPGCTAANKAGKGTQPFLAQCRLHEILCTTRARAGLRPGLRESRPSGWFAAAPQLAGGGLRCTWRQRYSAAHHCSHTVIHRHRVWGRAQGRATRQPPRTDSRSLLSRQGRAHVTLLFAAEASEREYATRNRWTLRARALSRQPLPPSTHSVRAQHASAIPEPS